LPRGQQSTTAPQNERRRGRQRAQTHKLFRTNGFKEKLTPAEIKLGRRPFGAGHLDGISLVRRRRMRKGQRCSVAAGRVVGRKPRVGMGAW